MKKYSIFILIVLCVSSFSGISQPPPDNPLPDPNYQAPTPPPNYEAPQPPAPVANNQGRTESAAIDGQEMELLLADLKKVPIEEVWRSSNGGYSVNFRKLYKREV